MADMEAAAAVITAGITALEVSFEPFSLSRSVLNYPQTTTVTPEEAAVVVSGTHHHERRLRNMMLVMTML